MIGVEWKLGPNRAAMDWIVFYDKSDWSHVHRVTKLRLFAMLRAVGVDRTVLPSGSIRYKSDFDPVVAALAGRSAIVHIKSDRPRGYSPSGEEEPRAAPGAGTGEEKIESVSEDGEGESPSPFAFDLGPALAQPQPPVVWLCRPMNIVKGRPTILSGYAGSIKTWMALDMALSVAACKRTMWGGIEIQLRGRVRHFDYENLGEVSARRYQRLAAGRGIDLAALGDRLGRVPLPRTHLKSDGAEEALAAACDGVSLAIIDSLRAACPGVEENDSSIREYLDMLLRVTSRTGTIFVVIHHEGKPPVQGSPRSRLQSMRGSSALADAIDCAIGVQGRDGIFSVEQTKSSWGKHGEPLSLKLVDEGEVDPSSGLSSGIRLEQVATEDAAGRRDKGLETCKKLVLELLRKEKRPLGSKEIRRLISGRSQTKLAALRCLKEQGEVVQDQETKLYSLPSRALREKKKGSPLSKRRRAGRAGGPTPGRG